MKCGSRLWQVGLFLIIASAGCANDAVKPAVSPVAAIELTEDGQELPIPESGITEVDENSSVKLRVNKGAAQAALASSVGVETSNVEQIGKRVEALKKAIASQQAALAKLSEYQKAPPAPADMQKAMSALSALEQVALDDLKAVATRAEINDMLSKGVGESYSFAITVLNRENKDQVQQLEALMAQLSHVAWRMQAKLYTHGGPQDLHLEGYDNLVLGDPNVINKLAIPTNLPDVLNQSKQAVAGLSNLESALQKVQEEAQKSADDLRSRLMDVAAELNALPNIADGVAKAPWASLAQGKLIAQSVKDIAATSQVVVAGCRDGLAQLQGLRGLSITGMAKVVLDSDSPLRKCVELVRQSWPPIASKLKALPAQLATLKQAIATDVKLAKQVGPEAVQQLSDLATKIGQDAAAQLSDGWQGVLGKFQSGVQAGSGATFAATEHVRDRAYRDIDDTNIDLVRSSRVAGDLLYYHAGVVSNDTETRQWNSPPLRIVANGLHVNVSGSVVFVRALKKKTQDDSFPAAPAATATLHYGSMRAPNANHGSRFWNFLDPGIGLHVAYLDLGTPSTEIGTGAVLQLFGDVLQGGVAYDLGVQRAYAFFGVGLQTATNFGLTVPASGGK